MGIIQGKGPMTTLIVLLIAAVALVCLVGQWLRHGDRLSRYEGPVEKPWGEAFDLPDGPSTEHRKVVASIEAQREQIEGLSRGQLLHFARKFMEDAASGREFDARFIEVCASGVRGEWVLAPGADPRRRVLYLHGGAFIAGSTRSHRSVTSRFSAAAGAAVLAVDYRLMPENRRTDSIEDCKTAWKWLLRNGPVGESPPERLYIGGDSAGGNLALMLSAWIRDESLQRPDAVVVLSPVVDFTFSSPSLAANLATDTMLAPLLGRLVRIPRCLLAWLYLLENRMMPSNPVVSPVMGSLHDLPPTLVQVSEAEMLFEDARRYVNKARAAGSPVRLQSWPHLLHVWQWYCPEVPEADQAWHEIGRFLASVEAERASPAPG